MSESKVVKAVQLAATQLGARLFRNNVGKTWIGKSKIYDGPATVKVNAGDVVIRNARRFHAGLCEGSADLIGWYTITITEEMVGAKVAVFTAAECKARTGRTTDAQVRFIKAVNSAGGLGGVCRGPDDFYEVLNGF
jgi:hypothetical protein